MSCGHPSPLGFLVVVVFAPAPISCNDGLIFVLYQALKWGVGFNYYPLQLLENPNVAHWLTHRKFLKWWVFGFAPPPSPPSSFESHRRRASSYSHHTLLLHSSVKGDAWHFPFFSFLNLQSLGLGLLDAPILSRLSFMVFMWAQKGPAVEVPGEVHVM